MIPSGPRYRYDRVHEVGLLLGRQVVSEAEVEPAQSLKSVTSLAANDLRGLVASSLDRTCSLLSVLGR